MYANLLLFVKALFVSTAAITYLNKGVGGIVGIGPFTMKNVNIRVNGLQTEISTQDNRRVKIYNTRINKNILPIEIGAFSLQNVNIEVNSTTPARQSIQSEKKNSYRLSKQFSNSDLASRLSRKFDSISFP